MDFYITKYQCKAMEALTPLFKCMTDGANRLERQEEQEEGHNQFQVHPLVATVVSANQALAERLCRGAGLQNLFITEAESKSHLRAAALAKGYRWKSPVPEWWPAIRMEGTGKARDRASNSVQKLHTTAVAGATRPTIQTDLTADLQRIVEIVEEEAAR